MSAECALCLHYESQHTPHDIDPARSCRVRYHVAGYYTNCFGTRAPSYKPCSCPGFEPDKEDNN